MYIYIASRNPTFLEDLKGMFIDYIVQQVLRHESVQSSYSIWNESCTMHDFLSCNIALVKGGEGLIRVCAFIIGLSTVLSA